MNWTSEYTFTAGYDRGLKDATYRRRRRYPQLSRPSKADDFRRGYDAGWEDGQERQKAVSA